MPFDRFDNVRRSPRISRSLSRCPESVRRHEAVPPPDVKDYRARPQFRTRPKRTSGHFVARLASGFDRNDIKINPAVTSYRQYCMCYIGVLQL